MYHSGTSTTSKSDEDDEQYLGTYEITITDLRILRYHLLLTFCYEQLIITVQKAGSVLCTINISQKSVSSEQKWTDNL